MPHVPLAGSEPPPHPRERLIAAPPDLAVRLSVLLKPTPRSGGEASDWHAYLEQERKQIAETVPRDRRYLTLDTIARHLAPADDSVSRLRGFLHEFDLHMEENVQIVPALQHVVITGHVAAIEKAFQVKLFLYSVGDERYLWHQGSVFVPENLVDVIDAVTGLYSPPMDAHVLPNPAPSGPPGVDPRTMADAYHFPQGEAKGQCIAVILLGGGYDPDDFNQYFANLGLKVPKITLVELGAQTNNPAPTASIQAMLNGTPPNQQTLWTLEASLDVELIGTLANDAHIVVYLAENSTQGKLEALAHALTDSYHPSVISCSFGTFEDTMTQADLRVLNLLCLIAGLFGVTICVSSGDKGDGAAGGPNPRVRFMASSPNVLACGGTHAVFDAAGALHETVWNELFFGTPFSSGGGVSGFFVPPSMQASANVPGKTGGRSGRGVPDVAAKADMLTGYPVVVRGFTFNMGGTSAAAPLWASLAARLNHNLGWRVGPLAPVLYTSIFAPAIRDVTAGNNGMFTAHPAWDACCGLGTPNGTALLALLS